MSLHKSITLALLLLATVLAESDTDLHKAARSGDVEAISRILSEHPESIDVKGNGAQTALVAACLAGQAEAVKLLLVKGADTTIGEKDGYTAMHAAAFQGRAEVIDVLLEAGLNPLETHSDGYYPMHRACWGQEKRHAEAVKRFLDAGIDPGLKSDDKAAKSCAAMTKNDDTTFHLKKALLAQRNEL